MCVCVDTHTHTLVEPKCNLNAPTVLKHKLNKLFYRIKGEQKVYIVCDVLIFMCDMYSYAKWKQRGKINGTTIMDPLCVIDVPTISEIVILQALYPTHSLRNESFPVAHI